MIRICDAYIFAGEQKMWRFKIRVIVIGFWPFKNLVIGWKQRDTKAEYVGEGL